MLDGLLKMVLMTNGSTLQSELIYFCLKFYLLFAAALGLCCCAQAFSSCSEQGLLFVAVRGLPIAVASLITQHGP